MYYGDEIIDEVRRRSDIVDLIGQYVSLKRAGSEYKGLCPFHNEKTPSFMVSPGKQMYYCFGCHKGGSIFTFLQEYENMTFVESVQYLAERAGVQLPAATADPEHKKREAIRDTIFKINSLAAQYYFAYLRDEKGKEGLNYLKGRELSDDIMHRFALGYAPPSGGLYRFIKSKGYEDDILKQTGLFTYDEKKGPYDKFWNRVMFPIVDRRNHVIGFGGRVMGDGKPKYLNSPETIVFDKSRNLFGINFIHGKLPRGIILCEGYMDVIALHQAGFTNAVAALGTAFTTFHASMIKRLTDQVYLCFDSDEAGTNAAMRAIPMLKSEGLRVKVIDMSPHKDPDEFIKNLSKEEFEDRIDKAKIAFFFETDIISKQYDMSDPESRTIFMNKVAAKILEFEDEIERTNYIDAFSREYGVRSEDFKALVVKQSAKMVGINYDKYSSKKAKNTMTEDAFDESQGILLMWLNEHPESFQKLKEYISKDDFTTEPYKSVASYLYDDLEKGNEVDAAGIINRFEDVDMQSKVAGIFHKEIADPEAEGRTISEVVKGILKHSLDVRSANATGIEEVQQLLLDKKKLENLRIDL